MMTNEAVIALLRSNSDLARASQVFSSEAAVIEQANLQRDRPTIIEIRRLEIETVVKILRCFGVEV